MEILDADVQQIEEEAVPQSGKIKLLMSKDAADLILQNKRAHEFVDLNNQIGRYMREAVENFLYIGESFVKIEERKLFDIGGYSDVYDYAEKVFGLKRTSVLNYISVYQKFGNNSLEYGFNYTQLVELVPVADDPEAIKAFKPSMSIKEIRTRKFINRLSEGEKQAEFLLLDAFPAVFRNWNSKQSDMNERVLLTDYKPRSEDDDGNDVPSKLIVSFGSLKLEVERNEAYADHLFTVDCRTSWYYEQISTVKDLTALLEGEKFKKWYSGEMAKIKALKEEKEKAAKAKAEGAETTSSKQTLKNNKQREAFLDDRSNWALTNEAEIIPGVKMKVYSLNVNTNFVEIWLNEKFIEYRRIEIKYFALYQSNANDIVRWLTDNKI